MKQLLFGVVGFLLIVVAHGQIKPKYTNHYTLAWSKGSVIFNTGDTLHCDLRYHQSISNGTLQVMEGETIITLNANEVTTFSFFDEGKSKMRKFSTLLVSGKEHEHQNVFVERLYDDQQFSILNHKTVDVPYDYMNYSRFISKPVPLSKKYILDVKTGVLWPLSKENVLRLLEKKRTEISSFINQHHIKFKRVSDYIDIFQYHSSL